MEDSIKWSIDDMVEVKLKEDDDFLKVKETLTRIGIASRKEKKLFQSCHILHKQGKYYIVHFKELFALDGKATNISENDLERRNTVANLLHEWELVKLVDAEKAQPTVPIRQLKILPFGETILAPASVNTSADASTATKFTFSSPVYLEPGNEYCIVVMSNSNEYTCWVSEMGGRDIATNDFIDAQPYAGSLFKSQNNST